MGIFSLMSRKPAAAGLNKNGVVTSREFKNKIVPNLAKKFGRQRGANIENILMGDMDRGGSLGRSMTAREASETLKNLENNHRDDLSSRDIEKLKDIINSQL